MTPDRFLYLVEGLGDRLPYFKQEFPDMSEEDIVRIANSDPTEGKYVRWILSQVSQNQLRFPEDHEKVHIRLTQFDSLKKKRNFSGERDINRYKSYGDLAQTIDQNSEVKTKGEIVRQKAIEGARLLAVQGNLAAYEITTVEAGLKLGWRNTDWCVKDPEVFKNYDPPFYMLTKNGGPYKLLHPYSTQLMDVYDNPTPFDGFEILGDDAASRNPYLAFLYAFHHIKGRFSKGEPVIAQDAKASCKYAEFVIKERFPEGEPVIAKDSIWAHIYARGVLKGRWPEAEPVIAQNAIDAYSYALEVIKDRWYEAEPTIMRHPDRAYRYACFILKRRWPEAEPTIAKDPHSAYLYAKDVIGGRWPEAEPTIAEDPKWTLYYAKNIVEGRWPEGEHNIIVSPHWAYHYADMVIGGRWPEAEPTIAQNPKMAYYYAIEVIHGRFLSAESSIFKSKHYRHLYTKRFLE